MTHDLIDDKKSPVRFGCGLAGAAVLLLLTGTFMAVAPQPANALPKYTAQTGQPCGRCHVNPAGGGPRTAFGKAFAANGHKMPSKSHKAPAKSEQETPAKIKVQAASTAPEVVASQKSDQWLASNFKGTEVVDANGKKAGSVSDILFDKSGKIDAYVVKVGGFLGIDAKEVAIVPSAFQVIPGKDDAPMKLKLSMDQNALKKASAFSAHKRP